MARHRSSALLFVVLLLIAVPSFAAPPAPSLLAPADSASVLIPFTISWSAVTDPAGIVAYNWQVSPSDKFSPVILQNSTNGATLDVVSGLAKGTYFWRVQAVNGSMVQGAWSNPRRFNVAGSNALASPTLGPTKGYSTFHPWESVTFNWSAVTGASTYILQASTDASFPVATRIQFDNIPQNTFTFVIVDEGNYSARVLAVDANGVMSAPSNVITFSVFFNNPIGPAPVIISPVNNPTVTLPVTLSWADVPNPQSGGYEVQVAKDASFQTVEDGFNQIDGPQWQALSLTPGTKYWHVRSMQGDSTPLLPALTAWSATGSFTIPATPPAPASIISTFNPIFSGQDTTIEIQLTSAVSSAGATVNLSSSDPLALPMPATVPVPPGLAFENFNLSQFGLKAGQVTAATPVTITATLNGASASTPVTVMPPSIKTISMFPTTISGGAQASASVILNGQAPAGGAVVSLTSDSAAAVPPASVTIPAGVESAPFVINTTAVTANTIATITATWNGGAKQVQLTVTPPVQPASVALSPTSTVGLGGSSFATVTVASPSSTDSTLQVTSSNPAVASVPNGVTIPAGSTTGGFNIFTTSVPSQTAVTISVSGGGVTRSAVLTVNPDATTAPAATSATLTVNATGRSGERVLSTPAGISVAVGSTGSATFAAGTSITLSVSNGRDAIWSGACSSGGNKAKTCTFTLNGSSSVTGNVQ